MPDIGEMAPDFTLPANGGKEVTLSSLRGQKVVLYFYPKDDTSGCTVEAIDFTARAEAFAAANTIVLGISKDSVKAHEKFIAKHSLGVALLSDTDGAVCEAYGVWKEKKMYGRSFMGIERSTFLVDASGIIRSVWTKVKVDGHAEAVLAAARG